MSALWRTNGGEPESGGIGGYPLERLYEEVAFIAYYFHWPEADILDMPHTERVRWCEEISKINQKVSADE